MKTAKTASALRCVNWVNLIDSQKSYGQSSIHTHVFGVDPSFGQELGPRKIGRRIGNQTG